MGLFGDKFSTQKFSDNSKKAGFHFQDLHDAGLTMKKMRKTIEKEKVKAAELGEAKTINENEEVSYHFSYKNGSIDTVN